MTAPDPLPTVTDSATAFEERLAFADDVELTPAQAAARHIELTADFDRALERTQQAHASIARIRDRFFVTAPRPRTEAD